jgi:hypothetical protein
MGRSQPYFVSSNNFKMLSHMKTKFYSLVFTMTLCAVLNSAGATVKIDNRRVYNPAGTDCLGTFSGKISHVNPNRNGYDPEELAQIETTIIDWMYGINSPIYMKDLDSSKFHWQFIESSHYDPTRIGVLLILPHGKTVGEDFYTTVGGGLEIPAIRCYNAPFAWVNNGEIISFVVDTENMEVEEFMNWRLQHQHSRETMMSAYYSQMVVNYKTSEDLADVKLFHFVDGQLRAEIPVQAGEKIYFPKGRFSTLVFYIGADIKGLMCFDMMKLSMNCPMNFESTVYLKERLGYEKVLYAEPLCEGIYEFSMMDKSDFEALTTLEWQYLLDLPGIANF